ncbi:DUF397 domain-containing protein [Actinomadura sp. WMMB 499]|uniref:DUF397 domain-containing protein n=1 Tax=Actinomadura sp. WMMB 499 TaxID=1219491 RepID=UPI001245F27D|nr:DUF397 domain-containing protein [Actinomadura sp. WMMB 499]QFG20748.1 DUF397 domain-containing protein [Actinomadura sp. WMMB 499]
MDAIAWRKASRSNDQGHECVELASLPKAIAMRDSKDPDGAKLVLGRGDFLTLLDELKRR